MDAIGFNCHVNESRVAGGARGGGGGGKTLPIKLVNRVRKFIPSLCLLPRPSLTKYSVSNSLSVMEGTSLCPSRFCTYLPYMYMEVII